MTNCTCDHCLLVFPERKALYDEIDGHQRVFCCHGCRSIYLLIHTENLDAFYGRRIGWEPGPQESLELSLDHFLESVRYASDGEYEIDIGVSGIRCASCIWLIEHMVMKTPGVLYARVNYATHHARIRWSGERADIEGILKRIQSIGYSPRPYAETDIEGDLRREKKDLLVRFGTASFFSLQLMMYTTALYAGYFQGIEPMYKTVFEAIACALATPVMFYCGYPFIKNSWKGMKNRSFSMDTLVFLGSFSAYLYSVIVIFLGGDVYFDTSSTIITLILLGKFIEAGARVKATRSLALLIGLQPKEARLIRVSEKGDNVEERVPVSQLKVGDTITVIPGEKIPVDCIIEDGRAEVDESMLTGESMPVQKVEMSEVFAGTINLDGRLIMEVKRIGRDTVLAQIIKAVEDAQVRKAGVQTVADRVVGWFVPLIVGVAAITFAAWFLSGSGMKTSLMNAVSVLVIACPCALGLATPLAILIGSTILSSYGVLIKGGDIIEAAAQADTIVFDKTGTLTLGKPQLTLIIPYGVDAGTARLLAASLERNSEHAIARAICHDTSDKDLYSVEMFRAHPGRGVEGFINGSKVVIGSKGFLESSGIGITDDQANTFHTFSSKGNTVVGIGAEGRLTGWFVISDELMPEASDAVRTLQADKYHVTLLTGDYHGVAEDIGKKAGITHIEAERLPLQKVESIQRMKKSGRRVIMVGDGINDAPSLTEADAGIAVGRATDIALESADVVLMRRDLLMIPCLLRLAKKTMSVIRQNLFWAFSYNLIAIPLAVAGAIHPILSALFMAVSSLMVVGNSLRLYTAGQTMQRER